MEDRRRTSDGPEREEERFLPTVLGLTAAVLQTLVLGLNLFAGLNWGGWSWYTAVALTVLGLPVIFWMTLRRLRTVILVPFVTYGPSAALTLLGPGAMGSS